MICFTYAGGSASFFEVIERELTGIELIKPEYAGHGTRHKEKFYQNFDELADDIYERVKRFCKEDYALFGYSMGSISLVEVLKRIIADPKVKEPSHVFLAAHEPHSKTELTGFKDDELDEWVKDRTIKFGAVPEKLINNKTFWRMYLPLYRTDYSIIRKYRFEDLKLRSNIPATVFYSESDTPLSKMNLWKNYFIGEFDIYRFEGKHFFIKEHHAEIAQIMKDKIRKRGK